MIDSVQVRWDRAPRPARDLPRLAAHSPLASTVARVAARRGSAPAFAEPTGTISYERLMAGALDLGDRLLDLDGWSSGARVGIDLPSGSLYATAFLGTLLAGGVAVPIPPGLSRAETRERLEWTGCLRWLSAEAGDVEWEIGAVPAPPEDPPTRVDPDDLGAILFTSGSGGRPKAVMLSHRNLLANARSIGDLLSLGPEDRALVTLPFQHAFGNSVLQSHLVAGGSLVVDPETGPLGTIDAARRHRVTNLYAIPDGCVLIERLLRGRSAPPDLRFVGVAGGRLSGALAVALADRAAPARLHVMYGQTEATARLAALPPERLREKPDSIGHAIPGVRIEVVDERDRPVEPGEAGMIRARGDNVCLGYWRDPEGTARILRDGWLYTQDLGTVDDEGFLYHRGRADEVAKVAGKRVDLGWLARRTEAATPAIRCLAVPFETISEISRIALFYIGPAGAGEEIAKWCRRELPEDERPARIEEVSRFPTLGSGKPDVSALSRRAKAAWFADRTPIHPEDA